MSSSAVWRSELAALAFLIDLAAANGDNQALANGFNIGAIERDQFRTTEAARKAYQQERPIPRVPHPRAHGVEHLEQILADERLGLILRAAPLSLYAAQRRPDDFGATRIGEPPRFMRFRD
ncbi:MAG: hypothetical protein ACLPSW_25845 [Roseiarcus sp.]